MISKKSKAPRKVREDLKHPIDRTAPASVIAAKFGSVSALGRAIGRTPSTVHRWIIAGQIPPKYHPEVVEAGRRLGIKLRVEDFVDRRLFKSTPAAPAIEASAA